MSSDKKLEAEINEYAQLAKENPKIDASMLMMNALQTERQSSVSPKAKRWAYLIAISLPPVGLLFALNYFMKDDDESKQVAWMCVILTVIAIVMFWIFAKVLFSASGTSVQQIQQIKTKDIYQLTQ